MSEEVVNQSAPDARTHPRNSDSGGEMMLSPADIQFMPCAGIRDDVKHNTADIAHEVQPMDLCDEKAGLKVVEKGGVYFSLDNARLGLLKRLQREGRCTRVRVEQVPLKNVSPGVQDMMAVPVQPVRQRGRLYGKGPMKLLNILHLERRTSLTSVNSAITDDDTDDSDFQVTDSECDWSADVRDSSSLMSSGEDTEAEGDNML
ncbi:uncharacterized protein LOC124259885 [Haliotis rubra]|uniref:uncharacterized protein LOC124259885 n=1 Tax=Haliotis rubra TaxID=36100 RepID=UPI001EE55C15|nr:uncharacterized protein LOC124259885 [Haliotis rubra]